MSNSIKDQFDFKYADKITLDFLKSSYQLYQSTLKKKVLDQIYTVKSCLLLLFCLKKQHNGFEIVYISSSYDVTCLIFEPVGT